MDEREILESAGRRIRDVRSAEVEFNLRDATGAPLSGAEARIRQIAHEFKFGCNAFLAHGMRDEALQGAYGERFSTLLNYATLPFYWGGYEEKEGQPNEERLGAMACWCAENHVIPKGHPLVWHEVYPAWAKALPDGEVLRRLEARVRTIVARFKESIQWWDVVNEATVSARFENAVGRWMGREGAAECVWRALNWAHEANPQARLIYNDFNISPDFEKLAGDLLDKGAPVSAIGIQSHMHKGLWPIEMLWQRCDTYARFGQPLHFTEATILSGRLKAEDDNDWHTPRTDWLSTPEGEAAQAVYGEKFCVTLFSHPAVEAITWWDFSDHSSWQGAPAGMVGKDMSPKPLYARLMELIHKKWNTDVEARSDSGGKVKARCFFGTYEVTARCRAGETLRGVCRIERRGPRVAEMKLGQP